MKKRISMLALATLFAATSAQASGYRIPEQSVDSTAKAGANIASASRADTTYFNPANMSFIEDRWMVQGNMSYIHLTKIKYDSNIETGSDLSTKSDDENFLIPTLFAVSPYYGDFRFGLSVTTPNGLSKRWREVGTDANNNSDRFSLQTFEINPTVSYKVTDTVSIAGGLRAYYAAAQMKNALFDLDGDTWEWGWNVAVAVQPIEDVNFSVTYRSTIDLDFSVNDAAFRQADDINALPLPGAAVLPLSGSAATSVPSPGVLTVSTAFKPMDKLTVELTWDRTFWSQYESLRIKNAAETAIISPFTGENINPYLEFESDKEWDDTDAFRIGLSYEYNDKLTLMGGFAYDNDPVPSSNLGYELPDSPAWIYSAGFQYEYSENLEFGLAVLYDYKEERKVTNDDIDGEFSDASAWFVTTGISYKF